MKLLVTHCIFINVLVYHCQVLCNDTITESKDAQIEYQLIISIDEAVKKIKDQQKTFLIKNCQAIKDIHSTDQEQSI